MPDHAEEPQERMSFPEGLGALCTLRRASGTTRRRSTHSKTPEWPRFLVGADSVERDWVSTSIEKVGTPIKFPATRLAGRPWASRAEGHAPSSFHQLTAATEGGVLPSLMPWEGTFRDGKVVAELPV